MLNIISEIETCWSLQDKDQLVRFIANLNARLNGQAIVCIAAGRMGYSMRGFAMRLMHIGESSYFMGDTCIPRIDSNSVVIFSSVSGETRSNILYAKQAKEVGSTVFTITQDIHSTLAQLSDEVLTINCGHTGQVMKTLAEQYTFLLYDYIISELQKLRGLPESALLSNHSCLE